MRKESAIVLMQEIEKLCEGNDQFCDIVFVKRPYLTGIKMEVSIKIGPESATVPAKEGNRLKAV